MQPHLVTRQKKCSNLSMLSTNLLKVEYRQNNDIVNELLSNLVEDYNHLLGDSCMFQQDRSRTRSW